MKALLVVDRLSTWVGHVFAWLIVALAAFITWEVGSRYLFHEPHAWAFDAQIMLYGTLFMLAGAYTLAKSGHVRGDILYGYLKPRTQAAIDLVLYLAFFVPGVVALVWAGYEFAADSWAIGEHSSVTSEGPPIYPFKTVIPIAGAVLLLQGLVEIVRCLICLTRGEWPPRELDVKEVDVDDLKTMVHRDEIGEADDAAAVREQELARMRKELRFGFALMVAILAAVAILMPGPGEMSEGHLGLLMLSLIVVTIMLGFPTAFTLMGMGVIFAWLAYRAVDAESATQLTLSLMVYRAYAVMSNEVLIAIPLFVFMGYLVERANLIEKLFRSIHLALAWVPGSLAVATLVTSALFATATGIIGAVVTLMGLLALPAMLKAGYGVRLSTGSITAGGCLGILIPPSVLLILYGATAGVSVVQLYAGAFFPGLMLAGLYVIYVIVVAKIWPQTAPPLPESERRVVLPPDLTNLGARSRSRALPALVAMLFRPRAAGVSRAVAAGNLLAALFPLLLVGGVLAVTYAHLARAPEALEEITVQALGYSDAQLEAYVDRDTGLAEPPGADMESRYGPGGGLVSEPPSESEVAEGSAGGVSSAFWIVLGVTAGAAVIGYSMFTFERLTVLRMLLSSFFPLAFLIAAVLGTIVFGLATPAEAAAAGAVGGYALTAAYRLAARPRGRLRILLTWLPLIAITAGVFGARLVFDWYPPRLMINLAWISLAGLAALAYVQLRLGPIVRESVLLTARTTAMVCWLFVGSSIFSAAFALLGGQALIEQWVLSLDLTPLQFLVLAQVIIFLLGWPLEWTEIIVIFMPIFIPLLGHFNIDPLFFGLLVALNLQTAFLSPPVAMAAFYLKGVAPPEVSLNQIFGGVIPFMVIQIIAIVLLYVFPQIGLWLPRVLYA